MMWNVNATNESTHPGRNPICQLFIGDVRYQRWLGSLIPQKTQGQPTAKRSQRPFAVPHPQIDCRTLQLPPLLAVSAPSGWKIGRAFTRTAIWSQVERRETQPSVPDQGPQGHDFLCMAVAKPFLPSVMWTALTVHSVDVEHLTQEWLNVEEGCHLPD